MADIKLLKSVLVRNGYDTPANGIIELAKVAPNTAYSKLKGDNTGFTEKAMREIYRNTDMTLTEFEKIFL